MDQIYSRGGGTYERLVISNTNYCRWVRVVLRHTTHETISTGTDSVKIEIEVLKGTGCRVIHWSLKFRKSFVTFPSRWSLHVY